MKAYKTLNCWANVCCMGIVLMVLSLIATTGCATQNEKKFTFEYYYNNSHLHLIYGREDLTREAYKARLATLRFKTDDEVETAIEQDLSGVIAPGLRASQAVDFLSSVGAVCRSFDPPTITRVQVYTRYNCGYGQKIPVPRQYWDLRDSRTLAEGQGKTQEQWRAEMDEWINTGTISVGWSVVLRVSREEPEIIHESRVRFARPEAL